MKDSAKTLRDLSRSSDSVKDSVYNVGLSDNASLQYYLGKINEKEALYASYFDGNGAILAGKYEEMQRTYGEINSLVGTVTSSMDSFDPDRKEFLKDNLYSMLTHNQSLADSNAKVMEVMVKGGTLDKISKELSLKQMSTLLGSLRSRKTA